MTANKTHQDVSFVSLEVKEFINLMYSLNIQVGFCGALILERYHELRKREFLHTYAQQIPTVSKESGSETAIQDSSTQQPMYRNYETLTQIILEIQHVLYAIQLILEDKTLQNQDSYINQKSIEMISNVLEQVGAKVPKSEKMTLPIGNKIAMSFFSANHICQQVNSQLSQILTDEQSNLLKKDYLLKLEEFLLLMARWSNLNNQDGEWFWNPKFEMAR